MPPNSKTRTTFADYRSDARNWITLENGEYYPDILKDACKLYEPVLVLFGQLLSSSESSTRLFLQISDQKGWMRTQLCRVFRRYACPELPVEMTGKKKRASEICDTYGSRFRAVQEIQAAFSERPSADEALCALLWEYKSRGKKGYDFTERMFDLFESHLLELKAQGPRRAGKDVFLGTIFTNYPNPNRAVDFVIRDPVRGDVLVVGLARYDSGRGGAQEDDRTGSYRNCADEVLNYVRKHRLRTKVIFINDGPGLLLGSMWSDYAALERSHEGRIMVATLRMIPERITRDWLLA